jgi:two-component system, NtrC family, nitrogen regulation sensor histidine kinase NtrY
MTASCSRNKEVIERSQRRAGRGNERIAAERGLIGAVLANVAAGVLSIDGDGRDPHLQRAALAMLRQREERGGRPPVGEAWSDPERGKLAALLAPRPGEAPTRRFTQEVHLLLGGEWKVFEAKVTPLPVRRRRRRRPGAGARGPHRADQGAAAAAWNEAARRIAHEIKNPLTPIKLSAERVLRRTARATPTLGEALEEGVETIVREVDTCRRWSTSSRATPACRPAPGADRPRAAGRRDAQPLPRPQAGGRGRRGSTPGSARLGSTASRSAAP